jgi:ubiquinone/menaquinone biosynthesis C-methylase UbiE
MQSPQATQTPSVRTVCGHARSFSAKVGEATPDHGTTAPQTVYQRRMTVDHLSTREGYDRWAEIYDTDGNPLIALEEPQVDLLLGDVTGLAVADIGCGTGRHALRIAGRGARVTAVDFSEQMLAKAKAKPGAEAITFVCHDLAHGLPLADASFDRVTCGLVVDHIGDLAGLFGELGRIVRPDGIVVVSVMHPAMMLKGVQARFTDPSTGRETRPASHANQISDYVRAAVRVGLRIAHISEHAVDDTLAAQLPRAQKYLGWPMLFLLGLRR